MSGGFGRGKAIEQSANGLQFSRSHFAQEAGILTRENEKNTLRSFASRQQDNFSGGGHYAEQRYDRENEMNRLNRFTNNRDGNRGSGFWSGFNDGNDREGGSFSDFRANKLGSRVERGGGGGNFDGECNGGSGFSSGRNYASGGFVNVDESNGFSSDSGGVRGFGSSGSRAGGFGGGGRGGSFASGRSGFDGGGSEHASERFGNRSNGFGSGDRGRNTGFSGGRRSGFDSAVDGYDNRNRGLSSGRGVRSFRSNRNNDSGSNGQGTNNRGSSFGAGSNFSSGFSSEGGMNFSNSWGSKENNGRDEPRRFVSYIPEDRSLEEMYSEDAANAKYEISDLDQEVTVTGVPHSQKMLKLEDWANAGFGEFLLRNIVEKSRYTVPRRIQAVVVPLIQNGWDMLGHAETGSGKTAAFVLPIINYIITVGQPSDPKCAPIALILAPTRELVGQLYNQTRKFADGTGVTVAKAYGQYRMANNIMELEKGCNMLFATMGRLMDLVEHGMIKLHNIKFFVLDEADRMLSQDSFCTDIMNLVHSPGFPSIEDRQTLLFSATFIREVQELATKLLKRDHAFVSNGKATAANPLVQQTFVEVASENKLDKLIQLLEKDRTDDGDILRTLVFVQKKQMADVVALNLVQKGIPSSSINGDREQKQRDEALRDFRKGDIRVLVATDVCARGIDVKDLEHVINFDMPDSRVTYVHRIGRTGRLHEGKATSFIDPSNESQALIADIVQVVREVQQIAPDFLVEIAEGRAGLDGSAKGSGGFGGGFSKGGSSGGFGGKSGSCFARAGFTNSSRGFGGADFSGSGGAFSSGNSGGGFASGGTFVSSGGNGHQQNMRKMNDDW